MQRVIGGASLLCEEETRFLLTQGRTRLSPVLEDSQLKGVGRLPMAGLH